MKKLIIIIFMLSILLSSCSKTQKIILYFLPEFETDDSVIELQDDFPYNIGYMKTTNKDAERTKEFLFCDNIYHIDYKFSIRQEFTPYLEDFYFNENGICFGFNAETGALTSLSSEKGISQSINENPITEEDFKDIADAILNKYILIDEYEVDLITSNLKGKKNVEIDVDDRENEVGLDTQESDRIQYSFSYTRKHEEIQTLESAVITLDGKGRIITIQLNSIGYFKTEDIYNHEIVKDISETIKKSINEPDNTNIEIDTITLCKTQDNNMYYIISASIIRNGSDGQDIKPIIFAALENK